MTSLYCFPPAGLYAKEVYADWPSAAGSMFNVVPMDAPGRGVLATGLPVPSPEELVRHAADGIASAVDGAGRDWALFGHSLGAMVAYEAARVVVSTHGSRPPRAVFVSAKHPPGEAQVARLADLDDNALLRAVDSFGALPPEVWRFGWMRTNAADRLRGELVASCYSDGRLPSLACPVHVLGGRDDPLVSPESLARWATATTGPFSLKLFDGGHMFVQTESAGVVHHVARLLGEVQPARLPATSSDSRLEVDLLLRAG